MSLLHWTTLGTPSGNVRYCDESLELSFQILTDFSQSKNDVLDAIQANGYFRHLLSGILDRLPYFCVLSGKRLSTDTASRYR